jgi:hypothetical protein
MRHSLADYAEQNDLDPNALGEELHGLSEDVDPSPEDLHAILQRACTQKRCLRDRLSSLPA